MAAGQLRDRRGGEFTAEYTVQPLSKTLQREQAGSGECSVLRQTY